MKKQMLLDKVSQSIQGYDKLMLAFSGGVDSTVLLHLLVGLCRQRSNLSVRAVHIHHGLSNHAEHWVTHCQQLCARWQVPITVMKVQIAQSGSIEAAARSARYHAFGSLLTGSEVLLTAHHLDDQCETFMLALKRGSGPLGLSSMAIQQPFSITKHIRPLLHVSREQIEHYAQQQKLSWVNDDSNQDARFDRNFLRLRILPLLQQRWPHFANSVLRSATLCAEQEQLLDELLQPVLISVTDEQGAILIDELVAMSAIQRAAVLRRWIAGKGALMPAKDQLSRIWREVALARDDSDPKLKIDRWQIRRFKNRLHLLPLMNEVKDVVLQWNGKIKLQLPDNIGSLSINPSMKKTVFSVRAPNENELVTIRFSAKGSFKIVGRNRSRTIKKLWQEYHIAPWLRSRIPLLFYGETMIAAVGIFVTQNGEGHDTGNTWQLDWH